MLVRFITAVMEPRQRHTHVFAPAFFLAIGKRGFHRQRDQRRRVRAGKPQQQRPYHARECDEHSDRIARQADEGRPAQHPHRHGTARLDRNAPEHQRAGGADRVLHVIGFAGGNTARGQHEVLSLRGLGEAHGKLLAVIAQNSEVSDLGILRDDREKLSMRLAQAAQGQDLVLTSGGVSTGVADYVKDAIGAAGSLVFWRVAIKPGRPVAMGVLRGTAFVGLPGNPVAVFVTFARVVRPLLLRLAGANPEPLIALPVKSGFAYKKKKGRREYVRVSLTRLADGSYEAHKHPQDGAGVISSLTATDGLAELADDVTEIAKGQTIGFLPYSVLAG